MLVTAIVTLLTDTYEGSRNIEVFCTNPWCIFGCFSKEWFSTMILFGFFIGVFCNTGLNYAVSNASFIYIFSFIFFSSTVQCTHFVLVIIRHTNQSLLLCTYSYATLPRCNIYLLWRSVPWFYSTRLVRLFYRGSVA